ncbi:MAG: hypothetical protein H0W89_05150, partial [Candidatus Levybacteria bacterium]|nr:hypothetical protein [Candidatus Levybacteria bacterium]
PEVQDPSSATEQPVQKADVVPVPPSKPVTQKTPKVTTVESATPAVVDAAPADAGHNVGRSTDITEPVIGEAARTEVTGGTNWKELAVNGELSDGELMKQYIEENGPSVYRDFNSDFGWGRDRVRNGLGKLSEDGTVTERNRVTGKAGKPAKEFILVPKESAASTSDKPTESNASATDAPAGAVDAPQATTGADVANTADLVEPSDAGVAPAPLLAPSELPHQFTLRDGTIIDVDDDELSEIMPFIGDDFDSRTKSEDVARTIGISPTELQKRVGQVNDTLRDHGVEIAFKFGNGDNGYYYRETEAGTPTSPAMTELKRILDVSAVSAEHRAAIDTEQPRLLTPGEKPGEFVLRTGETIQVRPNTAILLSILREGFGNETSSDQLAKRLSQEVGRDLDIKDIHNMVRHARVELADLESEQFVAIRYDENGRGYYLDHKTTIHRRRTEVLGSMTTHTPLPGGRVADVEAAIIAGELDVTPSVTEAPASEPAVERKVEEEAPEFATLTRTDVASLAAIVYDNHIQRQLHKLELDLPDEAPLIELISPRAEVLLSVDRENLISDFYVPALEKAAELMAREDFNDVAADIFERGPEGEMVWSLLTDVKKLQEMEVGTFNERVNGMTFLTKLMTDPASVEGYLMAFKPVESKPDMMTSSGTPVDLQPGEEVVPQSTAKGSTGETDRTSAERRIEGHFDKASDGTRSFRQEVYKHFYSILKDPAVAPELPAAASPGMVTRAFNQLSESVLEKQIDSKLIRTATGPKGDVYDVVTIATALLAHNERFATRLSKVEQKKLQDLVAKHYNEWQAREQQKTGNKDENTG